MDTYKATNTNNGKFYIGSTTDFEKRKRQHLKSKENYPFQNSLRKNPEAFEWEVWSDNSDEPVLEQALLDMWFGTEQCYNLNPFASRPSIQMSVKNGNKAFVGKTGIFDKNWRSSSEFFEHQANAGKIGGMVIASKKLGIHDPSYIQSEEYKEQRRKTGTRLAKERKGMFSAEIREKSKQNLISALGTPIVITSPSGENLTFPSIREASRATGIDRRAIKSLLQGSHSKWSRRGWKARFEKQ